MPEAPPPTPEVSPPMPEVSPAPLTPEVPLAPLMPEVPLAPLPPEVPTAPPTLSPKHKPGNTLRRHNMFYYQPASEAPTRPDDIPSNLRETLDHYYSRGSSDSLRETLED
ncbi:hypothetical protein FB446DRAFT_706577 [Lentinula raphanica]|nr:hypothetical protein FB446DRAFT_706577 [Lentinula raphanica]